MPDGIAQFPLPGDTVEGHTVVASVDYTDDPPAVTVLLLNKESPYFTVAIFDRKNGGLDVQGTEYNIVPAVELYKQCGGDY